MGKIRHFRTTLCGNRGIAGIEYALLLVLISLGVITSLASVGDYSSSTFYYTAYRIKHSGGGTEGVGL